MKRGWIVALIVVLLTPFGSRIGGVYVSAGTLDEFEQLRGKWEEMLTGGRDYDPADPYIAARIADIDLTAQGYWDTMDKSAARTYLWSEAANVIGQSKEKTSTYTWLAAMALAYATKGSALEGNAALRDDIMEALDWLHQYVYNETMPESGGWWDWQIGVPLQLHNIVALMYDDLGEERIGKYMTAVGKFATKSKLLGYTGANRVWLAGVISLMGALTNNSQQIADARDALSEVFLYATKGDGFYEDGSFIQHNTIPYNGGYGRSLLIDVSELVNWLDGSAWEVTDPNLANVIDWVYQSFEPFMHKGLMMDMTRGREISRYYSTDHTAGQGIITAVMNVADFAPESDAAAFRSMAKSWIRQNAYRDYFQYAAIPAIIRAKAIVEDSAVPERTTPEVYRQFAAMDRTVQVRPDYTFGLSMSSDRISTHEVVSGENLRGWYTAEGMTYLYNTDISQYTDDFWPTVNAYRLPGTTVDTRGRVAAGSELYRHPLREAGGAELGAYGTSAMKVKAQDSSLVAKKSWFAFDDEIVALGAGITSTDNRTIETTVENRKLAGAGDQTLTVNGEEKPSDIGWAETMSDVHSVHLSGNVAGAEIGYYFPGGAEVKGLREQRTGAWSQIDARGTAPTDPITRPYMTLWFDHGANPNDATYEYVLLPSKTVAETEAYAAAPSITVLENSPEAQAVREDSLNVTGIQFWNDEVKTVGGITSNKRAAVMTEETEDEFRISISDPSQTNTGTIDLEIDQAATAISALAPGITVTQLSPTIKLSVHPAGSLGQTFHAGFRLTPVTSAPDAPTSVKAALGQNGEVKLTWEGASQVTGYKVKYGTSSGNYTETVDVGAITGYEPEGVALGQTYYFAVSAYNSLGESRDSDEQAIRQDFKVVDNDSADATVIGEWLHGSSGGRFYGTDYLHDGNAARGTKSVTYTPRLSAGTYKVSLWWLEHPNRSTVVPVEIGHAGGTDSVTLNQRNPGSGWHELGVYSFAGGSSDYVTLSNTGANGYVVADAVKFEYASSPVPEIVDATAGAGTIDLKWKPADHATGYVVKYGTASGVYSGTVEAGSAISLTLTGLTNGIPYYVTVSALTESGETPDADEIIAVPRVNKIMDDADTEGVVKVGEWGFGTPTSATYGPSFIHDRGLERGTKSVTFTPDLPAGTYKVYMWWTGHTLRANNVPVTIRHDGGTDTVAVNQRVNGGRWNELGQFRFQGGESEYVMITNPTTVNGIVEVDAVRFEQVLPVVPEVTGIVPGNGSAVVQWTPIYDATGYVIKYGTVSGQYSETAQVSNNVSSYSLPGLMNGIAYYVTVSALRPGGESPNAAEAAVTLQDTSPPSVPGNVTATAVSDSSIALSWDASTDDSGVAGYKVYRDGTEIVSVTDSVYTDSGLLPSTTYVYAVAAYDGAGNVSDMSEPAAATTLAEETEEPQEPGPSPEPPPSMPQPPAEHTVSLSDGVPIIKINEVKLLQELLHAGSDTLEMDLTAIGGVGSDVRKLQLSANALRLLEEHGKQLAIANEGVRLVISPRAIATEQLTDALVITVRKEGDKAVSAGLTPRSVVFSFMLESGGRPAAIGEPMRVAFDAGEVRNPSKLAIYAYDETAGEWTFVGGAYDSGTNTISFKAEYVAAYTVLEYSNPFADVDRVPWAQEAIDELAMRGIMKGTGEDVFAPGRAITRAEFVVLINRLLKLDEAEYSGQFADVEAGAWYANAIAAASHAGIIRGDGAHMNPDASITREEMAVILMRAIAVMRTEDAFPSEETTFADDDEISLWAKAAIGGVARLGIMTGKPANRFDSKSESTRAEAAAVAYRMIGLLQDESDSVAALF